MPELNSSIAAEVLAACKAGASELAQGLGRIFGADPSVEVGEPGPLSIDALAEELSGPGLAVLLTVGTASAVAVLPESSGLLPAWYAAPDPTGVSKLATFAQEASLLLLPESLMAEEFRCQRVDDITAALRRAGPAADANALPITLKAADGRTTTLHLIFSFSAGDQLFAAAAWSATIAPTASAPAAPTAAEEPPREKPAGVLRGEAAVRAAATAGASPAVPTRPTHTLNDLPSYTKSLLRIQVPVMVTLASKKHQVSTILEIGPGTILQFKKSCDQLLELEVNGHAIGVGEAVKVGEKFGLRVTSLTLPGERFTPLGKAS
ncbi:MAG: hypothetical protein C0483_06845 [Pirellula sp.]|nr:hypothetical protein [Pirellula sp.]